MRNQRTIILGEPGSGKSAAMKRMAWELVKQDPPVLVFLVSLYDYSGESLLEWVRRLLTRFSNLKFSSEEYVAAFLKRCPYDVYFLLDGLNEAPIRHREALLRQLTWLAYEYPDYKIAVTSRIHDESWRQLRHKSEYSETLVVQPISKRDAQQYLHGHLGKEEGKKLWQGLDQRMRELALTPLLLWFIKDAYISAKKKAKHDDVRIPENRGGLYHDFVTRRLQLDSKLDPIHRIPEFKRTAALEKLALHLQKNHTLVASREDALQQLGNEKILNALLINGLLAGDQLIRFAPHQTIQEYFAARAIQREAVEEAQSMSQSFVGRLWTRRKVLEYAREAHWWETFIQLAGLTSEPDQVALAISQINPWLAWWCIQEGRRVSREVRNKIGNLSEALALSSNKTDRRNAVQTLVRLQSSRTKTLLGRLSLDPDSEISQIAFRGLLEMGEEGEREFKQVFTERWQELHAVRRAEGWRYLSRHDSRRGVGTLVHVEGKVRVPDIDWVLVPDDGRWTYQNDDHRRLAPFRMSRYPITYTQFQTFLDDPKGYEWAVWWNGMGATVMHRLGPGTQAFPYENHPRENVSWYEAIAFCRWYSWRCGGEFRIDNIDRWAARLPTEYEWEKAARGRQGHLYPYGSQFDPSMSNTQESGIGQTTPVGIFPEGASAYGVEDMSGNVWEWCLTDRKNPQRLAAHEDLTSLNPRALRGGSWRHPQKYATALYCSSNEPDFRNELIGFRLVAPVS